MTCTCPKCHQKIELDLPEVTEAGTSATCPACNARFNVFRESFGGRALRKSSEISCASCGSELGPETFCPSCGAQFPEYLVISLGRRRARDTKKIKLKTSPFLQKDRSTATQLPSLGMSLKPEEARHQEVKAPGSRFPKPVVIAVSLVLVLALVAAGSVFYLKNKAEKVYAKNFVLATYCVQTGVDRSLKATTRMSAEWKAKADAGQPYAAHPSADDERDFGLINGKLDLALSKLNDPPKKFAACNDKLSRLQGVYGKLRSLVSTPGTSQQIFVDSASKLDGEYKLAAREYKSGMPDEIMGELVSASMKFKGLKLLLSR